MVENELDEKLLIETAQRDPRRFADLYRMHFDRVYAYVARRVATRSDAQDLTAEVFQQALANLGRFEWRGVPFAAWLYRIAANAVTDHHHRTVRDQNVPPSPEPGREELESAERRAALYRAVRDLPADQRRVIEMRFAEDRSIAEIARVLGRSEGAVKQLQFRALGNLRARLDQDDG
ncbi:MAG: RNA polymerase sigma factor [Gemmatimonadales bacterium]